MKLFVITLFLVAAAPRGSMAGEVMLLVDSMTKSNTVFCVTNSTSNEVFVLPICLPEQFYPGNFFGSNGVSRWGASGPVALGQWRDFIPLDSGQSFKFTFTPYYPRRWRITCIASTKRIQVNDPLDETNKLKFHSIEFPPGRPYFTLISHASESRNVKATAPQ